MKPLHVTVCRRISFSSGHRTYRPDLDEAGNRALYGPAYSPHGHGHNFILEAYLTGMVDPSTGMVVNLKEVDQWLKEVTDPLDHHFLNTDVPYFAGIVPTTENLAIYCYQELLKRIQGTPVQLTKIRLHEGADLWVDCEAADGARE